MALFLHRSLLFILPLVFCSFVLAALAEHGGSLGLFSAAALANALLGAVILFFHCAANAREAIQYSLLLAKHLCDPGWSICSDKWVVWTEIRVVPPQCQPGC